jgi:GT2 family glycosyltransferase
MKIVSIIIPHYNGKKLLYNCINSIYQNIDIDNFEIIVVDNASTDNSIKNIQNLFSDVIVVSNKKNIGYSGGCNIGAQHAKGKYLIFLNNDTEHSDRWIEKLVDFLEEHPSAFAAQPKVLNINNKEYFDYAGGAGGFIDCFGFPYVKGRLFNTLEKDTGQYDKPSEIFWSSGAAMIVRADIFNQLSGFDEVYFAYMEEIDLCWRAQALGYKIWSVPSAFIYHYGKQTIKENTIKSHYLNHRNSWILFFKNSFTFNYGILILKRLILDWMALIYSVFTLDIRRFIAILYAELWILFSVSKIIKIIKSNDIAELDNIYNKSIAIDYFIKGKKYFFQIEDNNSL